MKNREELVKIFVASDNVEIISARALLEGNGFECFVKNEALQSLWGMGQVGTGFNLVSGPMELYVLSSCAKDAFQLLKEHDMYQASDIDILEARLNKHSAMPKGFAEDRVGIISSEEEREPMRRSAFLSIVSALLWILGWGSLFAIYLGFKAIDEEEDKRGYIGIALGVVGIVLALILVGVL